MKNLTVLSIGSNVGGNGLTGTIPTELGLLTSLTRLGLQTMGLIVTIPREFGNLVNMKTLLLHNTYSMGTIPSELLKLEHLEALTVSNTLLTGSIPDELCPSALKEVTRICLSYFGVTGSICDGFTTSNFTCAESALCGCSCTNCTL